MRRGSTESAVLRKLLYKLLGERPKGAPRLFGWQGKRTVAGVVEMWESRFVRFPRDGGNSGKP